MTPEPRLIEYGIQLERSDVRVHVSPATRRLFVFQTAAAQKLLEERGGEFKKREAYQPDVEYATAKGWLVPCSQMPTLRTVAITPDDWWSKFKPEHKTSTKGQEAARLVERALREGRIPLPYILIIEPKDVKVQRSGADILVWGHHRIQVKCDWLAGPVELGGSGNLFLQYSELNPRKRH
jgi:hypothetical protein